MPASLSQPRRRSNGTTVPASGRRAAGAVRRLDVQDEPEIRPHRWDGFPLRARLRAHEAPLRNFNFSLNRWYDLRVVTRGPNLRFYVDGTLRLSAKDFSFLGGKIGLYSHRANALFDEVRMFF